MQTALCPTADQLRAFQAGRLAHEELDQVAAHLDSCAACQTALASASTASDALLRELKGAPTADGYTEESACRRAVAGVEALGNADATQTRDDTADNVPQSVAPIAVTTFGKYQLLEAIGKGGMGEVYKARHTLLNRIVALKILPAHRLNSADAVARFRREIEAAGRLDHPHIVRTSDADSADGRHFLVMEWLAGADLSHHVKLHGPLPVDQACEFIRQAAIGLECAHKHGMVHRDVKPSNLYLTCGEDGRPVVKVLDLGLALLHDAICTNTELTSDGQVMGTYDFIAPEQAMESHTVDHRADIYSLGCTFYFLLTGRTPFQGKSEAKKLLAHQLEEPPPIENVPTEVIAIVKNMMAKDPAKRLASMREVAAELASLPSPSGRGAGGEGESQVPSTKSKDAQVSSLPTGRDARNRRPIVLAASIILGLAAVIALVVGIIRITTPEGDFIIETDDPKIKFSVSKGVVTLHDEETGNKYELRAVRKASGEYELDVTDLKGGLSFQTPKLTIRRGEKVVFDGRFERKPAPIAKGMPVDDAWIKMVQALPPEKQVDAVAKKLKDLNPGFDGKVIHKDDGKVVTSLAFTTDKVTDISPVRALTDLQSLKCGSEGGKGQLDDLSPLKGMNLTYLLFSSTLVSDLTPLKGMPLRGLSFGGAKVFDLSPLESMPLTSLDCQGTLVTDLSPLKGMSLVDLHFHNTNVSDLSPVKDMPITNIGLRGTEVKDLSPLTGMPLKVLICTFNKERDAEILRSIKTLDWINGKPAAEFWAEVEAKSPVVKSAPPLAGHTGRINSLSFSKDGSILLSASSDATLRLWDVQKGTESKQYKRQVPHKFHSAAMSPDARFAVAAVDGHFFAYAWFDLKTGTNDGHAIVENQFHGSVALDTNEGRFALAAESSGTIGLVGTKAPSLVLRTFKGHKGAVSFLAFSQNCERVLSSGADKTIRLWDAKKDRDNELGQIAGSGEQYPAIAMSPDARFVALSNKEHGIQLWDFSDPAKPKKLDGFNGHKDHVLCLAFSLDGKRLASGGRDKQVRLWDVSSRAELRVYDGHTDEVTSVTFSPVGDRLASAGLDYVIRLWQLPIEELPSNPALVGEIRRYLGHAAGINFITLSPDGKSFLTGSSGELWLWDIDKDTERVRFPDAAGNIMDAGFSLDGQRVIGPAQIGTVVVWDVKPGEKAKEAARFKIDNWVESAFALSDPARVFYANRFGGRIYDLDKKAELPARFLGERAVRSKDGKRILSADGKALYLWDASGKELSNVELPGAPFRIALASDGKLALAAVGNNVHQWDMDAKKEGKRLDTPASVYAVAISPDGKRALTGGFDKKLRLWDLATGKELHCFHDHTGPVSAVAFLPDGRQALSGSSDKSIRLWQLSDESAPARTEVGEVRTYLGHDGPVASVAFAPDGKSFLSGSAGEIFQWDPGSSKPRHRFADKAKPLKTFGHYALVTRISFSKDGSHAITGGVEQPVRIWDVAKGQVVKYVDVPKAASHFVAWSPDDKYLLVAPSGTFVRLFAFPSLDESNDRFGGSQGHFSRDGNILLTLERGVLQTYQLDKPRRTFVNVRDINVCALTPDGRYAVCGGLDSMIYVWDMVAKKQIHKMPGHKGTIQAIAISPDGKRALTGSGNDSTLRLWDLVAGKEIRSFEGHTGSIVSISFSPDGTQALTAGSTDKSIKLWQLPD